MDTFKATEYSPAYLFRNGHLNTIYPTLFRSGKGVNYTRTAIDTPDGDFLDVDCILRDKNRLAIICHGLEGSSTSQYAIGMSRILSENNWDTAAINYRGCSGRINLKPRMYHSGATDDLHTVFKKLHMPYDTVVFIGFSLGGNLVLKYCGERSETIHPKIKACVAVSTPTDLEAGSRYIGKASNYIYEKRFLVKLGQKVRLKHQQFPEVYEPEHLKHVKSLYGFDDVYTSRIHGFANAKDYYTQCSSGRFLAFIKVPTLLLNALDDPFLPDACYPYDTIKDNKHITMHTPRYGGHVGFTRFRKKYYWSELYVRHFLDTVV